MELDTRLFKIFRDSFVLLRAYSLWIESTPAFSVHLNPIDLFSLDVLFSKYRSRDNTLGNRFFQISSYSRAYLRIIYEKTKGQVPLEPLLGKQNIQAEEVYYKMAATEGDHERSISMILQKKVDSYTSTSEIRTLLYTLSLEKEPLSGGTSPYRPL